MAEDGQAGSPVAVRLDEPSYQVTMGGEYPTIERWGRGGYSNGGWREHWECPWE